MMIKLHGGECCGIKTIHGLGAYPDTNCCEKKELKKNTSFVAGNGGVNDMRQYNPKRHYDFYKEAAPKETYLERLDRMLAFIKEHRPHGVVEIVLNSSQNKWFPLLKERGFKKSVSSAYNSNSGGSINIFHLVY